MLLSTASTSAVPQHVSVAFVQLSRHIAHVPVDALYASSVALCAPPFAGIHAQLMDLLALALSVHTTQALPPALLQAVASLQGVPKAAAVMGAALRVVGPEVFVQQLPLNAETWPSVMRTICMYGQNSTLESLWTLTRLAPRNVLPVAESAAAALATLPTDLDKWASTFFSWVSLMLATGQPLYACQAVSALVNSVSHPAPPHYLHPITDETRARYVALLQAHLPPLVATVVDACHHSQPGPVRHATTLALEAMATLLPPETTLVHFRSALEAMLRTQAASAGSDLSTHYAVLSCFAPLLDGKHAAWLWDAVKRGVLQGRKGDLKLLAQLCKHTQVSGFVAAHGPAVTEALVKGAVPTHAKRHRLAVWRCLAQPDPTLVLELATVEIVYGLRESQKCRREAARFLEEVVCALPSDQTSTWVSTRLSAVFALPDPHALSAAVAAFTTVANHGDLDPHVSEVLLRVAVTLLRTAAVELAHSVTHLLTVAVNRSLCGPDTVGAALELVRSMPDEMQTALRRDVKVLVERGLKRFGLDATLALMKGDADGKRLVQVLAKKRRKKAAALKRSKTERREQAAAERFQPGTYDDVLENAAAATLEPEEDWGADEPDFPVDERTGKMLIEFSESGSEDGDEDRGPNPDDFVPSDASDSGDDDDEEGEEGAGRAGASRKRGLEGGKAQKRAKGGQVLGGEVYKARKADGDVRKGKMEPFAYMRLDPKTLNRRRAAGKSAEQYKDLLTKKKPHLKAAGHKRRVGKKPGGGRFYSK